MLVLDRAPLHQQLAQRAGDGQIVVAAALAADAQGHRTTAGIEQAIVSAQARDLREPRAGEEQRVGEMKRQALTVSRLPVAQVAEQAREIVGL